MEQYDFTDTGNAKDIYGLLDCMSEKELEMAREAVRNIRGSAPTAAAGIPGCCGAARSALKR